MINKPNPAPYIKKKFMFKDFEKKKGKKNKKLTGTAINILLVKRTVFSISLCS